jgi:hypothetical protein
VGAIAIAAVAAEAGEIAAWNDVRPDRGSRLFDPLRSERVSDLIDALPPSQIVGRMYATLGLDRLKVRATFDEREWGAAKKRSFEPLFILSFWLCGGFRDYLEFAYGLTPSLHFGYPPSDAAIAVLSDVIEYGEEVRFEDPQTGWLDVPREFALMAAAYECQQRHKGKWAFSGTYTDADVELHKRLGLKLGDFRNFALPAGSWDGLRAYFEDLYFTPARARIRADTRLDLEVLEARTAYARLNFRRRHETEYNDFEARRWG